MKKRAVALLLLFTCFLSGCQSAVPVAVNETEFESTLTLAPPDPIYDAPTGDAQLEYYGTATLYLPRKDGLRFVAQYAELVFSASRHEAETVIRALLTYPETEETLALGKGIHLQLTGNTPVEISHDVLTVNLAPSCLALDTEDFFVLCQAITNTVTEFFDIKYVNVLVSGKQVGLDIASMLPLGTLQRRIGEDLVSMYNQIEVQRAKREEDYAEKRFTSLATLYYPAAVGNGILPEVRTVSFDGQTPSQVAKTLLDEMSLEAHLLTNIPELPEISDFLLEPPNVYTQTATGDRIAEIRFAASLNEALAESGITRSALMAAITYTLTTFIPQLSGVTVYIGDELVTSVTPSSVYRGGETIVFQDGIQRRNDYSSLLLGLATLYFATPDGKGITPVKRPVPYYEAQNPRFLINQLILGPKPYDDNPAVQSVLPDTLRDADLLGFAVFDSTILIHLSKGFQDACQGYGEEKERLLIYAMVNTLSGATSFKRVRFFVAGIQPESLCGALYLPGEFMQNSGIVQMR